MIDFKLFLSHTASKRVCLIHIETCDTFYPYIKMNLLFFLKGKV